MPAVAGWTDRVLAQLFDADRDGLLDEVEVEAMLEDLAVYHAHRVSGGSATHSQYHRAQRYLACGRACRTIDGCRCVDLDKVRLVMIVAEGHVRRLVIPC